MSDSYQFRNLVEYVSQTLYNIHTKFLALMKYSVNGSYLQKKQNIILVS